MSSEELGPAAAPVSPSDLSKIQLRQPVSVRSKPRQPESAQPAAESAGTLLSVNVGMPKDVPWQGRTVFTGVFKDPVSGPRRVRRLNIDGDGQGDLAGHGGEQRAVFVYQIDSYRYWERELGRNDFVYGQFGENFTVEGLTDDEVCIGDRYRIGSAVFEVTQPRVTCYRVGIRMNDPRIPALLVSHHRPGFYFRVLEEGEVQAGDEIIKLASGPEQMPVAEVDALLYLPGHPRQQLLRALRIPALSPGWQASFRALLEQEPGSGNAGLAATSPPPAWPGFRQLTVTAITRESDSVISIRLEDPDGAPLPAARPGQYLTLRVQPDAQQRSVLRNYSLSGPPDAGYYRVTVKREPDGAASGYLHTRLAVGDQLDIAAPRGTFILDRTDAPVLLISAGIGATPVLAMLQALARGAFRSGDLVAARRAQQPRAPVRRRGPGSSRLAAERTQPRVLQPSRPRRRRRPRLRRHRPSHGALLAELEPPRDAEAYLCGPRRSWTRSAPALAALGIDASRIHTEPFGPAAGLTPGIAATPARAPHPPAGQPGNGPTIEFARSNLAIPWNTRLRQPARTRRSLRRARPLVVPDRRLPHLRDHAHRRRCRLQPRPGRTPRRRKRAHLLLTATRRHGARSVTGKNNGGQDEHRRRGAGPGALHRLGRCRALQAVLQRGARRQDRLRRRRHLRRAGQQLDHHQRRRRTDR